MKEKETYNTAFHEFMSRLLYRYLQRDGILENKRFLKSLYVTEIPIGAVVVPYLCESPKEWFIGWYRGKNNEGYDLIESVETHEICRFTNCNFLYVEDEDFTDNAWYRYSDNQYKKIHIIEKRLRKVDSSFSVGKPTFNEDNSIELPIIKAYRDKYYTKTYRNLRAITAEALKKHCAEYDIYESAI